MNTAKIIMNIVLALVFLAIIFCLIVAVACVINGVPFTTQIDNWYNTIFNANVPVIDYSTPEDVHVDIVTPSVVVE